MTTWISPTRATTNWNTGNKSTVEKAVLTEDNFILLTEDNFYLLQEDDFPDWGGQTVNTQYGIWNSLNYPWTLSNPWTLGTEIDWSSPVKN